MKKWILAFCLMLTVVMAWPENFVHPWKGKKVAYLGDSVTDPHVRTSGQDRQGRTGMHFWDYLQVWLDITPYVYADRGMVYLEGRFCCLCSGQDAEKYGSTHASSAEYGQDNSVRSHKYCYG